MSANDKQVGGSHYQEGELQPWDVIIKLKLGFLEGTIFKYLVRWEKKGGVEDLRKAQHYLEKLIEAGEVEEKAHREQLLKQCTTQAQAEAKALAAPKPAVYVEYKKVTFQRRWSDKAGRRASDKP